MASSATKFLCLFLILGLASPSLATVVYKVGGDILGWNEGVNLNAWASDKDFKVGDVLEFNYLPLVHNVARMADENAFVNCITDQNLIIDASGSTSVVLNQVGDLFFTSSVLTDCVSNLKMKVSVKSS
ncbi:blue copper protein-like [Ipomoea triloba]|uniref:blue copper protein-like n=1 Tax=Ipomoea triloba TaxID=35885 RepID=UPI00125CEDF3|nr:blue copper protein-like [Ipomoea triloba]